MPIKLIYGMKDKVCPMESGLEYKESFEDNENIKIVGFPNSRHFPIEENEKSSIEHIMAFLGNGKVMMKGDNAWFSIFLMFIFKTFTNFAIFTIS